MCALAAIAAFSLWNRYETRPWTRDGRVRADVVRVASDMGGWSQVLVHDNQRVSAGQLLLVLDQPRFAATLERQTRRSGARMPRWRWLAANRRGTHLAAWSLRKPANATPPRSIPSWPRWQARAEQRVAQLNVQRTEVRATTDGIITNLDLQRATTCNRKAQALALIDTRSLRIEGYFENKLGCITEAMPPWPG